MKKQLRNKFKILTLILTFVIILTACISSPEDPASSKSSSRESTSDAAEIESETDEESSLPLESENDGNESKSGSSKKTSSSSSSKKTNSSKVSSVISSSTAEKNDDVGDEDEDDIPAELNENPKIHRGINFGNGLGSSTHNVLSYDSWYFKEEHYQTMKLQGFDHVRFPINFGAHAGPAPDYTIDKNFFRQVDTALHYGLDAGLIMVIDMHGWTAMNSNPDGNKEKFYKMWDQIAKRYRNYPNTLFFELLNEPHAGSGSSPLTVNKLNEIQLETIRIIRQTNPTRMICTTVFDMNVVQQVWNMRLPEEDKNLIVSVHNYSTMPFTHQGANWSENLNYPNQAPFTDNVKKTIRENLERAADYQTRMGRQVWLSEWGIYMAKAAPEDISAYVEYFSSLCDELGISWCYWEYCSGFGMFDLTANAWKPYVEKLFR